jgi:hypothetical protein
MGFGHDAQGSASTSFIVSRCTHIRKDVVGLGTMSVLPTNERTSGHAKPAPQNPAMSLRLTSSNVTSGGQRHLASY